MKTIYKYKLFQSHNVNILNLPVGHQILTVQIQDGEICVWALIDPSEEKVDVKLKVFGTGWSIDEEAKTYIGTVQEGTFVWHIFEVE